MSKDQLSKSEDNEMQEEYDFIGGVRGKYYHRLATRKKPHVIPVQTMDSQTLLDSINAACDADTFPTEHEVMRELSLKFLSALGKK